MSSSAKHEPLEQAPAERRLEWRLNADVRTQIRVGAERFGEMGGRVYAFTRT